ncbi:hypothetical protein LH935_18005 [Gordonia polyisoprenivorans]|uniref:hypothetical protein n=1 Tax=Gordonia polyisoprenivorans TaxID=84595 RepID=UPI0022341836|nr:hypothetical protein [uncultured Gordonia sp.]UZF54627.1 hypothetical protein LH935_18005 [Gordonia polyisoprenivorans]
MVARVPVFVSAPSTLNSEQQESYEFIVDRVHRENFEPRALGRSDFGSEYPLKEVFSIARHCSGGIVLGFEQVRATGAVFRPGTVEEKEQESVSFPTPWNNLEAGILFALKIPLMVFRQAGVDGGIFGLGVSSAFVQTLPVGDLTTESVQAVEISIQNWAGKVREHYRAY